MTIAPIPPTLGAVAAMRPEAASVLPNAPVAGTSTSGSAQSSAAQLAPLTETAPVAGEPPASAALDALALKAAQAMVSEGGLALLMADLTQALQIPGIPGPVQAAMNQILALRAPLSTAPTSTDIKAALTQSNPPSAPPATLFSSDTPPAASSLSSSGALKSALLGLQQSLETWLANAPPPQSPATALASSPEVAPSEVASPPLVAQLAEALRSATLPVPLQSALLQSLAALPSSPQAQLGASAPPNLPTQLNPSAIPPVPATGAMPGDLTADLKSFVPALADALQGLLDNLAMAEAASSSTAAVVTPVTPELESVFVLPTATPKSPSPSLPPASPVPIPADRAPAEPDAPGTAPIAAAANAAAQNLIAILPANIDPKDVMLAFQQIFKSWFDGASSPSSPPPPAAALSEPSTNALRPSAPPNAANAPPPPYRGGPTTAQPAVASTLPAHADAVTVGARLLRETNAALAHQELLQLASLPPAAQGAAPSDRHNPQWMFEIPFATPQGSAVAQFKISRDGGGGNKGGKAPVWRAQFSLDVEPMGPIHAQVVLSGDRTWVSLWAEREESIARLRQNEGLLSTALKNSNFVAEVAFHAGAPRQPVATAGHFLNHAS